jgi:CMP-N,N'-diacetyllegionaminic acid synthase
LKIVALIPARKGSKGLKDKNIKDLLGQPLMSYSIEAAMSCSKINKVYLNSDSEQYLSIGSQFGAEPFLRPSELSNDTATMQSVLAHFCHSLASRGEVYDAVIILYPVYPFRTSEDLDNTVRFFLDNGEGRPLIGVIEPHTHPYLCYERNDNGKIKNVMGIDENKFYRRQQYPLYYQLTMWACIIPTNAVSTLNSQLIGPDSFGYFVPNNIPHVNIDTQFDFDFAEFLFRKYKSEFK